MFKSFVDWLVSSHPVSNWVILIILFGLIVSFALSLKCVRNNTSKGE